MIIFIDTGVLGLLSSPNKRKEVIKSQEWLYFWLENGFILAREWIHFRPGNIYFLYELDDFWHENDIKTCDY